MRRISRGVPGLAGLVVVVAAVVAVAASVLGEVVYPSLLFSRVSKTGFRSRMVSAIPAVFESAEVGVQEQGMAGWVRGDG